LWVNLIAIVGIIFFGGEVPEEYIAMGLGLINLILRLITKEAIEWTTK
jgi:hypothetical protein